VRQPAHLRPGGQARDRAIAFNFEPIFNLKGRIDAYKEAIAECTEPLGQFKNDNVMMTNAVICLADRKRAREVALRAGRGYLYSMVCLYHDTMPHPDGVAVWPEEPFQLPNEEMLDSLIKAGWLLCGDPDEVAEQVERYQSVGCDQLVFGLPSDSVEHEEVLEMLELFGTKVIPSSTRTRCTRRPATASRRCASTPSSTTRCPTSRSRSSPRTRCSRSELGQRGLVAGHHDDGKAVALDQPLAVGLVQLVRGGEAVEHHHEWLAHQRRRARADGVDGAEAGVGDQYDGVGLEQAHQVGRVTVIGQRRAHAAGRLDQPDQPRALGPLELDGQLGQREGRSPEGACGHGRGHGDRVPPVCHAHRRWRLTAGQPEDRRVRRARCVVGA